jgi:hypothetical protein
MTLFVVSKKEIFRVEETYLIFATLFQVIVIFMSRIPPKGEVTLYYLEDFGIISSKYIVILNRR